MTTTAPILQSWPYQPGEAVYYVTFTSFIKPYTYIPATVLKPVVPDEKHWRTRVSILRADGRRATVKASYLIYRGYCEQCQQPAHEDDGVLFCVRCGQPAIAEPPPDRLAARLYGHCELSII